MIGQWKSQSLMHFASWFFLFWPSLKPASFLIGKGCWAIAECGDPTLGCIFLILFLGVSTRMFPEMKWPKYTLKVFLELTKWKSSFKNNPKHFPFLFFCEKTRGVSRMCCSKNVTPGTRDVWNFPQVSLDAYKDEAERLVGSRLSRMCDRGCTV